MPAPLDARERVQLCLRFDELGPDAPTLLDGWTTFDLAAHLVVRERNPVAAPGILLPAAARLADWGMRREKAKGFAAVVDRVRNGPPPGPFAVPKLREAINLVEYAIHHEDVRRANAMEPRTGVDDLQDALWKRLALMGRFLVRGVPKGKGLVLARAGTSDTATAHRGEPDRTATATGEPLELLLWAWGRQQVARVDLTGDTTALAHARFGL